MIKDGAMLFYGNLQLLNSEDPQVQNSFVVWHGIVASVDVKTQQGPGIERRGRNKLHQPARGDQSFSQYLTFLIPKLQMAGNFTQIRSRFEFNLQETPRLRLYPQLCVIIDPA